MNVFLPLVNILERYYEKVVNAFVFPLPSALFNDSKPLERTKTLFNNSKTLFKGTKTRVQAPSKTVYTKFF